MHSSIRGLMRPSKRLLRWGLPALVLLAVVATPLLGQESGMPGSGLSGQSLRPYRFVFYAYAILWLMVLGWVVSIARRLARLNRQLGD